MDPADTLVAGSMEGVMRIACWHAEPGATLGSAFAAHLHGRDLEVLADPPAHAWRWRVTSPHGAILADGRAPSMNAAEEAAEDEATAVHPPTAELLDRLLG
jgi:hypothetical protein